jgi:acetylxylan esterase
MTFQRRAASCHPISGQYQSIMARVSIFIACLALAVSVAALPLDPRQVMCVSGLYIIVARGSDEDPGEGKLAQVSSLIKDRVPGSMSVAVDYPAAIIDESSIYPTSVSDGVSNTMQQVQTYVDTCGSASRIVLLGYSQVNLPSTYLNQWRAS